MQSFLGFFSSLRLTIALSFLICIDAAWGSFLTVRYPDFYRALDRTVLFRWLFSEGPGYPHLTAWIFVLVLLIALFSVNISVCTFDRLRSIILSKKPWHSILPHLVHIGFVVALAGHLVGSLWGFRTSGNVLVKGMDAPVPYSEALTMRLEGLHIEPSPRGGLEAMRTTVTVLRDGRPEAAGRIEPNSPFFFRGMAFYHSNHGIVPTGLVLDVEGRIRRAEFGGEFTVVEGKGLRLGRPRSNLPLVSITSNDGQRAFLDISRPGSKTSIGPVTVKLVDYITAPYVILSINRDPGVPLIIAGSSILVLSMVLLVFAKGERAELVPRRGRR